MIAFLEAFDDWFAEYIDDKYPDETIATFLKSFGFVELAVRSNAQTSQPMPITINGTSDRSQVSLDDRFQIMTWFRLPGQVTFGNDIEGNDWAFGFKKSPVQKAGIRWIIAHRVELGEELIFDILDSVPGIFRLDGYEIASVDRTSLSLDADHETIYRTELGETVYEKHRFKWNIYAVTLNLNYILNSRCEIQPNCCDDSFLTEDGICFQTQESTCLITE